MGDPRLGQPASRLAGDPGGLAEAEPAVERRVLADGTVEMGVGVGGETVSRLEIARLTIRIGAATVRMDGIAAVETKKEHRRRGYARRLREATVAQLRQGDAALTMLYGIPDFYPRFGYVAAGPEHRVHLEVARLPAMPAGWTARPFTPDDIPAMTRLYTAATEDSCGAAVRPEDWWVWKQLLGTAGGSAADGERTRQRDDRQVSLRE
jgi:predicted acetyltransferase